MKIADKCGNVYTIYNGTYIVTYENGSTSIYSDNTEKVFVAKILMDGTIILGNQAQYSVSKSTAVEVESLISDIKYKHTRQKLSTASLAKLKRALHFFDSKKRQWRDDVDSILQSINL